MIYLDTSFLTPLFRQEECSGPVEACLASQAPGSLAISLWTRIEFASVMARDVRMGALPGEVAKLLLDEFDHLATSSLHILIPTAADFELAQRFITEFSTHLRGPDALHLAIAKNQAVSRVLSLDAALLRAARQLSIEAIRGIA
jgi:uncharacterized protein